MSGVRDLENRADLVLVGPLNDLRASHLLAGYFRIELTTNPEEHD
jgi:hypothetical protein